jgi:hypothetical protein
VGESSMATTGRQNEDGKADSVNLRGGRKYVVDSGDRWRGSDVTK